MARLYHLACSYDNSVFKLFYLTFEIEDLGHGDIDTDGNLVAVIIEPIPDDAALLPYQFTFGQVTDDLTSYIEDVDVH